MIAIYAGSFDPVTYGHLDIISRGAKLADKLIVGLLINPFKNSMFTVEERIAHLQTVTEDIGNVEVKFFSGLLADFARENSAKAVIRGLRSNLLPEYEMQMALANYAYSGGIETLFVFSRPEYMHLSSTLVKEVASAGGRIDNMVPGFLVPAVIRRYENTLAVGR